VKKLIALIIVAGFLIGTGIGCSGGTTSSKSSSEPTKKKDDK